MITVDDRHAMARPAASTPYPALFSGVRRLRTYRESHSIGAAFTFSGPMFRHACAMSLEERSP
jgi:hypothetical protein